MPNRPTQLSTRFLFVLLALLMVSFITGLGLWYVHELREKLEEPPRWTFFCQSLHGLVNPLICCLFGYLLYAHIPGGYRMRANRKSGLIFAVVIGGLILTGAAIYYSARQHLFFSIHLALGLILPVILIVHWVSARRWVRTGEKSPEKKT